MTNFEECKNNFSRTFPSQPQPIVQRSRSNNNDALLQIFSRILNDLTQKCNEFDRQLNKIRIDQQSLNERMDKIDGQLQEINEITKCWEVDRIQRQEKHEAELKELREKRIEKFEAAKNEQKLIFEQKLKEIRELNSQYQADKASAKLIEKNRREEKEAKKLKKAEESHRAQYEIVMQTLLQKFEKDQRLQKNSCEREVNIADPKPLVVALQDFEDEQKLVIQVSLPKDPILAPVIDPKNETLQCIELMNNSPEKLIQKTTESKASAVQKKLSLWKKISHLFRQIVSQIFSQWSTALTMHNWIKIQNLASKNNPLKARPSILSPVPG